MSAQPAKTNPPHTAAVIQSLALRRNPRPIALVDIDGIVQDTTHRLHHLIHDVDGVSRYKANPDWKTFVSLAHLDAPGIFVNFVRGLSAAFDIVYLTARVSNSSEMYWGLYDRMEEVVGEGHFLITRHAQADEEKFLPAAQFKAHIVDLMKLSGVVPALAIDDSHVNCCAFVEAGIPTLRGYNHLTPTQYGY